MPTPLDAGRLLIDPPGPGPWNMAVDEVLWEFAGEGERSLRFYSWTPATLSLGYFQPLLDRRQHAASARCPIVRRASGGGAIVHDDDAHEITYSVALPTAGRARSVQQWLYETMHHSLVIALSNWGIAARRFAGDNRTTKSEPFLCFQRHAAGDVLIDGHKVAGSAQRRSSGALLQHGSVLVNGSASAPELPGISQLSGVVLRPEEIRRAWIASLGQLWPVRWRAVGLSAAQRERAAEKVVARFAHTGWNERR